MDDQLRKAHPEYSGYSHFQENGQRIFRPGQWNETEAARVRGSEVYVSAIPRNVYETDLLHLLTQIGQVWELRLLMDFSGNHRGIAYVRFMSKVVADAAVYHLNGYEIRPGCPLRLEISRNTRFLLVNGLPSDINVIQLKEELRSKLGSVKNVYVTLPKCHMGKLMPHALLEFETHKEVGKARRYLTSLTMNTGITTHWADKILTDDEDETRDTLNIHIDHPNTNADSIEEFFRRLLEVIYPISIAETWIESEVFVRFGSAADAAVAMHIMNGSRFEGQTAHVHYAFGRRSLIQRQRRRTSSAGSEPVIAYNPRLEEQLPVLPENDICILKLLYFFEETTDSALASIFLEFVCSQFQWQPPQFHLEMMATGWCAIVKLPYVHWPLFDVAQVYGPIQMQVSDQATGFNVVSTRVLLLLQQILHTSDLTRHLIEPLF